MYTSTKSQIIEIIKKNEQIQVKDLIRILDLTPAAVHRALKKLMDEGHIDKKGAPPRVFYFIKKQGTPRPLVELLPEDKEVIEKNYLYIDPTGKILTGLNGFIAWMRATKNYQKIENCVHDYLRVLAEAQAYKNQIGVIDATERFKKIFSECFLDKVYYYDFYSLIKFGKTKIGTLLLYGKQAQDKKIIAQISHEIEKVVHSICKQEKIDAIAWVPHSLIRKTQFLPEVRKNLKLKFPTIEVVKVYEGEIPIPQKSLSKLEERIINAKETMELTDLDISYKRVLIIDDAVGSGATMNELARKIRKKGVSHILGFSIVGSYKGFEVIREV